jgi:hypothetical protein
MTKEEVLQKANEYCSEKGYTVETLTDDFKDKFSDFFAKKYQETAIDDESAIADLQFNLNTAFSATSKGITAKQKAFEEKENDYKRQLAELNKKLGDVKPPKKNELVIPKEVQEQLDELKRFKNEEAQKSKFKDVVAEAKKSIRQDLHKSFEKYAEGVSVNLETETKEQAKVLVERFQEIFKDSIGDIKPLAPKVTQQRDSDYLSSLPKVKVM